LATIIENCIKKIILDNGYITIDHFLSLVIPFYYNNNNSLGRAGDFITAPEASQLFGEMIGLYAANYWLENSNKKVSLVELGPGNGYLMSDFLRATSHIKNFHESIDEIVLYEVSLKLKNAQQNNLNKYLDRCIWFDRFDELEEYTRDRHCIFIANEFFDALPMKQFQFINGDCYEVCVILDKLEKFDTKPLLKIQTDFTDRDGIFEYSPQSESYLNVIIDSIKSNNGLLLLIDYGHEDLLNISTLQAIQAHKKINFLEHIGAADITYLVNFPWMQNYLMKNSMTNELMFQKDFLELCGIKKRSEYLVNKYGADKKNIESQLKILLSPEKMGELFKVLIVKN